MLTVFKEYKAIKNGITDLIEISGFRNDYLAKKMGLSTPNFSIKKQRQTWTDSEVEQLIEIMTGINEEVEELLLLQVARARKDEPTVSYEDYKKEIAKWK